MPKFRTVFQFELIALVGFFLIVTSRSLAGQVASIETSAGIAAPSGPLRRGHGAGPLVRAGVILGRPSYAVRVRLDYESAWMSGDNPESSYASGRDLRIVSVLGSGLIKTWDRGVTGYVILGGGVARMHAPRDVRNPYSSIFTARAGVGVRRRRGRFGWQVEVAPSLVFSDYATPANFELASFRALTAGIFF